MKTYKEALEKWIKENPEKAANVGQSSMGRDPPPKSSSASSIYVKHKMEEYVKKNPESDGKSLVNEFREAYKNIPDKKKVKYIKSALKAKKEYEEELKLYMDKYPDYKPKVITFVSKKEKALLDEYNGVPKKPPSSGYMLYCQQVSHENPGEKQSMNTWSQNWHAMAQTEKDKYIKEWEMLNKGYKEKLERYLSNLDPEERKEFELRGLKKSPKRKRDRKSTTSRFTAFLLFQAEKRSKFARKNPEASPDELLQIMRDAYDNLSAQKKEKFQQQESVLRESFIKSTPGKRSKTQDDEILPVSPYHLFAKEMKLKITELSGQERILEINERWRKMNNKEKKVYSERLKEMKEKQNGLKERNEPKVNKTDETARLESTANSSDSSSSSSDEDEPKTSVSRKRKIKTSTSKEPLNKKKSVQQDHSEKRNIKPTPFDETSSSSTSSSDMEDKKVEKTSQFSSNPETTSSSSDSE